MLRALQEINLHKKYLTRMVQHMEVLKSNLEDVNSAAEDDFVAAKALELEIELSHRKSVVEQTENKIAYLLSILNS